MKVLKAKEDFYPLYRKEDQFIIVDRTDDPGLLPIAARNLKTGSIYYFEEGELI